MMTFLRGANLGKSDVFRVTSPEKFLGFTWKIVLVVPAASWKEIFKNSQDYETFHDMLS